MNRSDSEEMAGRLLAAGCDEATGLETADLIVINTCAIREAAEQKVIGRQGQLAKLKVANPGLRVVLTGCSVREPDRAGLRRRYPAVDLFLRPGRGARARRSARPGLGPGAVGLGSGWPGPAFTTGATTRVGRKVVGAADHLAASRLAALEGGAVRRESPTSAWLPIVYGCDKTCTYCIVPFSRGPERSRPFDEILDEARRLAAAGYREVTLLGQNVNSYGHDLPVEARFEDIAPERSVGRRQDRRGRPDLAALLRAIDALRTADGLPAIPAAALRDLAPVGPVRPADRGDGRVPVGLRAPPPAGPVGRRCGPAPDGPPVHDRALPRAAGPDPRGGPGIAISTDVIVGFCGETEAQFQATLRLLETVRYDQVFAAAYSVRPGTPAAHLADDVPPAVKRRRLNELLALQEAIGLERNRARVGTTAEVLVETIVPARTHGHDDDVSGSTMAGHSGDGPADRPEPGPHARPPGRLARSRRPAGRRPDRPCRPVFAARSARLTLDAPGPSSTRPGRVRR